VLLRRELHPLRIDAARSPLRAVADVNRIRLASSSESGDECLMQDLLNLIRWMLLGLFRSKTSLEAEILALRHQLNVLRRTSPRRPVFSNFDRMILRHLRHVLLSYRQYYNGTRTHLALAKDSPLTRSVQAIG
jgi:hypothetical protein